ncbi:MAG: HEAT repeat domain-containing protein [Melioribacteraceae bacterium]|nr:MAG: HEAT repeat domain-containing protein [Melioribacteraceae bacterium]
MKHEKILEMIELYVLDELNQEERELIENKILESDEYKKEYESLKKFYSSVQDVKPSPVNEHTLQNFRKELLNKIEIEKEKFVKKSISIWEKLFVGSYKPAFAMATTLLVGFFLGYIIFSSSHTQTIPAKNQNEVDLDAIDNNEINISNIRFANPFSDEGEIEIKFDAVKPISYKGDASDPRIQRLLAAALTSSDNPGLRIRSVNTLSSQTSQSTLMDPKVKQALINALKTDQNAGVRREALNALMKFPYDDDIRDAYLFTLTNDSNPGLKVAAINALAELKLQGRSIDNELKNIIDNELGNGDEEYIKLKAASLIREEF